MKTIIAGSRNVNDLDLVKQAVAESGFTVTEVVSGGARGVDALGEQWAVNEGFRVTVFFADWSKHGKAAGPIRNREMAVYAEQLVAIWDGESRGTANMIQTMRGMGKPVFVLAIGRVGRA